jgi:hypothetical protein
VLTRIHEPYYEKNEEENKSSGQDCSWHASSVCMLIRSNAGSQGKTRALKMLNLKISHSREKR